MEVRHGTLIIAQILLFHGNLSNKEILLHSQITQR